MFFTQSLQLIVSQYAFTFFKIVANLKAKSDAIA